MDFVDMEKLYCMGDRGLHAASEKHVQNGLAMFRFGSGRPVLWMPYPMAAFTTADWVPLASRLAFLDAGFSVLTFDPPGSGESPRKPEVTMDEMISCALETVRHFSVREAPVVTGHSQGAAVALAWALRKPELTSSLVLISASGSGARTRSAAGAIWNRTHPAYRGFLLRAALFAALPFGFSQRVLYRYVFRYSIQNPRLLGTIEPDVPALFAPASQRRKWLRVANRFNVEPRLHEITRPVLLLAGRHDPQTPLTCTEHLKSELPNAALHVFEQSGHYPFLDEPEIYASVVANFLTYSKR